MNEISERPVADLRRNLRAPLIIQKIHLHGNRPTIFGYSKNVSRSGMYISTTKPIEVGQQIELEFQLPPPLTGTVRSLCEVVWKRPFGSHLPSEAGIGVRFVNLPEEISLQLEDWVRHQN